MWPEENCKLSMGTSLFIVGSGIRGLSPRAQATTCSCDPSWHFAVLLKMLGLTRTPALTRAMLSQPSNYQNHKPNKPVYVAPSIRESVIITRSRPDRNKGQFSCYSKLRYSFKKTILSPSGFGVISMTKQVHICICFFLDFLFSPISPPVCLCTRLFFS